MEVEALVTVAVVEVEALATVALPGALSYRFLFFFDDSDNFERFFFGFTASSLQNEMLCSAN